MRRVEHVMGMPVSLVLRGRHADDEAGEAAWQDALASLREADRVFSTWREDSYISRLGREEIELGDCPPEVAEVLGLAEAARLESDGAFDVRRVAADGTHVLDTDGVVKGWAVQRAAACLAALEGTDYCLSAGGDMVCRVVDPDAEPWQVGIEDPRDPSRLIARIPVRDGAVATSGFAHRGAHIVDARTGQVPSGVASVTVVAPDLTWADLDATSAFAMGDRALPWLRTRAGRVGLVVAADGTAEVFGAA
ncbi:thiamine biosynthesis lipoprotein [Nocardioides ginsengisegetis]|uniref:FAD:protein FMN transferase n=1 Tax=Nocardioides ginsengisegetis TaxID=661491 RepID=A0A7W3PBE8_9ACTN|nr:FAD:protein FMN transferase [Nocardioides ginsengisegetis]MBA8805422.1 thiamine biosynthesis lipoprotein [Nocardioides ginsengisegetis]